MLLVSISCQRERNHETEIDIRVHGTFDTMYPTAHDRFGVGVGHLMGGQLLDKLTKGANYNYPYFAINFRDDGKSAPIKELS
jgi:hypothetical protein